MHVGDDYSYPLNTEHPYPAGMPVKITKGFMKGQVGEIAGATQIGGYFIQKQLEHAAGKSVPVPEGPFFPDEFEPLSGLTELESA